MPKPIVLCAINSRYSHSALAVRSLIRYTRENWPEAPPLQLIEETIHEPPLKLLHQLAESGAGVFAFSCYIWNITLVHTLSRQLRQISPQSIIIWGGPEASSAAGKWLQQESAVDYIIRGEGENSFLLLLKTLDSVQQKTAALREQLAAVPALTWRNTAKGIIVNNPDAGLLDGADWPFPYTSTDLEINRDKIIYYESSRGCPFACSYCLSATDRNLRFRPLQQVRAELKILLAARVRQIKFVDRTFNCRPHRALQIWKFILAEYQKQPFRTNLHFEIAGDLLTDEAIELLLQAPPHLFQLEIGVQSIQPHVLEAINRRCDLEKIKRNIARLRVKNNINLHLDLIAGLPGETMPQVIASLEWVFALKPHHLQLGFLKVLPGTPMALEAAERSFIWQDIPPYEILASDKLNFTELGRLRDIALLLEQYWNSALLPNALPWLIDRFTGSGEFFCRFASWLRENNHFERRLNPDDRCHLVWQFACVSYPELKDGAKGRAWLDLLRLDYCESGQKDQPRWLHFWEKTAAGEETHIIREIRRRCKTEYPEVIHCRAEKYSFDLQFLLQTGKLRPGETIVVYDLTGQATCARRMIMSN